MTALLDAALRYAGAGVYVFPVAADGKEPITPHGHRDATTDPGQIRAWWTAHPDARIGAWARRSGWIVVDVDPRYGGDATLAQLKAEHGPLPCACWQRSGSGGEHIVLRDPHGDPLSRTPMVGKLGDGVDVKYNGYVVVEPSGSYEWLALDIVDGRIVPPPVPDAWLPLFTPATPREIEGAGIEAWQTTVAPLTDDDVAALRARLATFTRGPGGRGGATRGAIGTIFHNYGLSVADGAPYLIAWNEACGEPHSGHALERQLHRVAGLPEDSIRGHALGWDEPDDPVPSPRPRLDLDALGADVVVPDGAPRAPKPNPVALASQYVVAACRGAGGDFTLRRWRGDFYAWSPARGCYESLSTDEIESRLYRGLRLRDRRIVGDVRHALIAVPGVLIDRAEIGSWLVPATIEGDALDIAACANGLLHLPSGVLAPATPRYFSTAALGASYDPGAASPDRWLAFLHDLWPDDAEAIAALQEWCGYLITPDTRQQKILLLVGPKRSGKGTIMRVLTALLGPGSVAAPTLASLGTNFGLWPMIGKPAAIIGDARLGGRADVAQIVERLLSISGDDSLTIDRKHREPWTGRLSTRISVVSNELPRLTDASGALASRMLVLELSRSWYGAEDTGLTDRLLGELPGILLWAIDGWRRLRARGRFTEPTSSRDAIDDLDDLASPVRAWLREACDLAADAWTPTDLAFNAYTAWCSTRGHHSGSSTTFGRDLHAAGHKRAQRRVDGRPRHGYVGLRLSGTLGGES